jgi:VanZ family protein
LLKLPAPLVAAGIWYLSSQSILPQPKGILGFDKFQHGLAYLVLTTAIALWFSRESWRRPGPRLPVLCVGLGSLYGLIDELHQHFMPGRDCNLWDWLFDTLGAVLSVLAVKLIVAKAGPPPKG